MEQLLKDAAKKYGPYATVLGTGFVGGELLHGLLGMILTGVAGLGLGYTVAKKFRPDA